MEEVGTVDLNGKEFVVYTNEKLKKRSIVIHPEDLKELAGNG